VAVGAHHDLDHPGAVDAAWTTLTLTGNRALHREIEYRCLPVDGGMARVLVAFRDVTESRLHERQLAAFARAAETVAHGGSLRGTLD
jgi:hypothetical protein